MSLLDVIDRVSEHVPRPFIAPIPDAESVSVFVHQDNIPYQFSLRGTEPGWWLLNPNRNGNRAGVGRGAYPHEYLVYLSHLPRFYAIACYRVGDDSWLVVPFNASDANQRGWHNGEPQVVHLVRESVRPFDVVDARSLAGTLLYNTVAPMGMEMSALCRGIVWNDEDGNVNQDWTNAITLITDRIAQIRREQEEQRRREQLSIIEAQRKNLTDRARFEAEFVGAELVSCTEVGNELEITWEFEGYQHTSRLNRQMRLESAGICLGDYRNEYEWHNLSTTILAIQEGRWLRRFDLPEEAYL